MTHVMLALAFARAGHFLRSHPPHHRENVRAQRIVQERPWDPPVVFGERAGMEARPTAAVTHTMQHLHEHAHGAEYP